MRKIGFIGVGIMGRSMVRNLMKEGYEVHIYARTKAKVEDVISEGAVFHDSIAECVKDRDAVITIVGFPQDVEEVYFDSGNILDSASPGTYLIDMTTTSPMLAEKICEEGTKRGFHVLDAPVTGGDTGAKEGTLSILVGGERQDYEACHPLFEAMGTNINYEGKAGSGQHCKLANQIMIAGTLSGVCEALTYAKEKDIYEVRCHRGGGQQAARSLRAKDHCRGLCAGIFYEAFHKGYEAGPHRGEQKRHRPGSSEPGAGKLRGA